MPLNYERVWSSMNELESVTSKVCSAREILDSAMEALGNGNRDKAEALMCAADEFLQYYLEDFDRKFKVAWSETVIKLKNTEEDDDMRSWGHSVLEYGIANSSSAEYDKSWKDFWDDNGQYTDEELNAMCENAPKEDKVIKWQLPVEADSSGEYFVTFPDDLLEATGWKENQLLEWFDNSDGSYSLKKVTNTENT